MSQPLNKFGLFLLFALVGWSFFHTNIRVQRTLLGYDIGQMKAEEAKLLKQRASLTMELAKLTSRKQLTELLKQKRATTR